MTSESMGGFDYRRVLKNLQEMVPGAVAATFAGTDGIGIALYHVDPNYDSAVADAELAGLLQVAGRAGESLGLGEVEESILTTPKGTVVLKGVGKEFYIGLLLQGPSPNLGLARLHLRRVAAELAQSI